MDNLTSNHLKKIELSLPSEYYFDESFYIKELKKIWSKNWIYVCHVSRLKKKLSFLTYTNQINNGNIFIAPATPIKKKVISILFFL